MIPGTGSEESRWGSSDAGISREVLALSSAAPVEEPASTPQVEVAIAGRIWRVDAAAGDGEGPVVIKSW